MDTDNKALHAKKTKFYVLISLGAMFILSVVVAWNMSQNYRQDDSQKRYKLTKLYKKMKKLDYSFDNVKGYSLYEQMCSKCHGSEGQGQFNKYPPLKDSPLITEDFTPTIKVLLHGLQGKLTRSQGVYNGKMNPYKAISPVDMAHVLNYIRNSFGHKFSVVHPIEVVKTHVATISQKKPYTEEELLKTTDTQGR